MILLPLSKIPGWVILDVLPRLHRPVTGTKKMPCIPTAVVARFMEECMHQAPSVPGEKITAILARLETWGQATGRWTSTQPSSRQLVTILHELGFETYRSHSNSAAVVGWKLN